MFTINNEERELSFNDLPQAMVYLIEKVEKIEAFLDTNKNGKPQEEDKWFNLDQLCNYHPDHPAKATVYSWVSQKLIPYHKRAKKLQFRRSEIDAWIEKGRRLTQDEMNLSAISYNNSKRGGVR